MISLEVKRIFANFKNEAMFKHRTRIDAVIPFSLMILEMLLGKNQ